MRPTEYIAGDRRSRAAHDLEAEALRDELLAEALEGLETTPGDHTAAVEALQRRLAARTAPRRGRWMPFAAAAAILLVLTAGLWTLWQPAPQPPTPELAVIAPTDTLRIVPPASDTIVVAPPPPTVRKRTATPPPSHQPEIAAATPSKPSPDVSLSDTRPLDSVVVVAYGTRKKADFTGSVAKTESGNTTQVGTRDDQFDIITGEAPTIALAEEPMATDSPFLSAETMPSFQGGDWATFRKWVHDQLRYPKLALTNGIQGRVVLSFVIERDGRLTNIQVLQSPDRTLTEEALRVVKSSPRWSPGLQRDTPVRIKMTLPVDFKTP